MKKLDLLGIPLDLGTNFKEKVDIRNFMQVVK